MTETTGVILFAHGSRDPLWRLPIDAVAQRMCAQQPTLPVAVAFLELTEPDLPSTVEALMKQDVTHVRIVPMFLGVGKHVREDLPVMLQALRDAHPDVAFEPLPAVGEHPDLLDLLAQIAIANPS